MQRYHAVNDDDLMKIHETSLKILENVGINMTYEPAREVLKKHGAKVDGKTVFFPASLVMEKVRLAPKEYTLYARDPKRNVFISTEDIHYCAPGGSTYVQDIDRGRRKSTQQDFDDLVKLYHMMNGVEIHHVPCEMNEIPTDFRNKLLVYETYKYSDKPLMGYMYGYEEALQCLELAAVPFGGLEAVRNKPVFVADPCSVTPLCYEEKALGTMMLLAEYGQVQLVNSLGMSGTTSPITLPGNAAVQNAEILAGITLIECINPGA